MIAECIKDMVSIAETGKWTLEAQVRSYDLFDRLSDGATVPAEEKQAYLARARERMEKSKWVLTVLIPILLVFAVDMIYLFIIPMLFGGK